MTNFRMLFVVCIMTMVSCTTMNENADLIETAAGLTGRGLDYTCRLESGEVIVTTNAEVAESADVPKSSAFIAKTEYAPVDITNYDTEAWKAGAAVELKYLEDVLVQKLVAETAAWQLGDSNTLRVTAMPQSDLPVNERMIQLVRVKTHPKTIRYAESLFTRVTASEAALGETVSLDTGVIGEVTAIDDEAVEVVFKPQDEGDRNSAFGPVRVEDKGDYYRIVTEARQGALVRVGPAVGQIAEVTEQNFRVDYTHPFGGRELICDVVVRAIEQQPQRATQYAVTTQSAESTPQPEGEVDASITVAAGDLVTVAYTATLKSGELLWTTDPQIAADPEYKKVDGYPDRQATGPETIVVGSEDGFPGLAHAALGLKKGEHTQVVVPAAQSLGDRNPGLLRKYSRTKTVPVRMPIPAKTYLQRFGGFPIKGGIVDYNAYTKGHIVEVSSEGVILELSPVKEEVESDFGLTRMQVVDDQIHIHLTPRLGGHFELDKRAGRVVAVDDRQFTVDYNKPMAGESVVFDLKIVDITKQADFAEMDIEWIEDYEEGLAAAEKLDKPAVLVLYADWCGYCKKLINNTLVDPRIKMMRDEFVWVKINSDKEREIKALFEQKGFPLTVVLDSHGERTGSINGYRPAGEFISELRKAVSAGDDQANLKAKEHTFKKAG